MKTPRRLIALTSLVAVPVLAALTLITLLWPAPLAAATTPGAKTYVCPMAEHAQEFDHPGKCPLCGMELVEKATRLRVAVLVFQHAEDIDFTAPIEVFGQSGAEVFTVAASTAPIDTVFGLHLRPDYDLEHAPPADVILVPGGAVGNAWHDEHVLTWLRQRAVPARYVMSVCNGAFILAKAGLLDGLKATTTASHIEELASAAPGIQVVRDRFADNGKIITTGGLSAGIDGALHVLERERGRLSAEEIARGIEYRWAPDEHWSRAALADIRMPDVRLPADAKWEKSISRGDTRQWETSGRLDIGMTADRSLDYATEQVTAGGWQLRERSEGKRVFARRQDDGQTWIATFTAQPEAPGSTVLHETMTIRPADTANH